MNDFDLFKSSPKEVTPNELDNKVISHINSDLNPSHYRILGKMVSLHGVIGLLTLLFCPQFKLSFTHNHSLYHYFHQTFGSQICMIICGVIFIGTGSLICSFFFKYAELQKVHKSVFLYYLGISSFSLLIFLFFGAELYLEMVLFWCLGAIASSILFFEIIRSFKIKLFYPQR